LLALFGDVFERTRLEYVDPVDDGNLIENAINGMLGSLDPHSGYMTPEAFREMKEQTKGEFGGVGIEVKSDHGRIRAKPYALYFTWAKLDDDGAPLPGDRLAIHSRLSATNVSNIRSGQLHLLKKRTPSRGEPAR
jgi:hypothetical protein